MAEHLSTYTTVQYGVLSATQAAQCGYSSKEIERLCAKKAWTRLRTGIYLPAEAPEEKDDPLGRHRLRTAAALLAIDDAKAVVADISAAVIHGLEWVELPDLTDVVLVRPGRERRYSGLRVRQVKVPASHVVRAPDGMPVLSVARTLVDLARRFPLEGVLAMADDALRRNLTTRAEIDGVLTECARLPGVREAARKLAFADGRAESVAESVARAILIELGFTGFDIQVVVRDENGKVVARLDIAFPFVAIEIDGKRKYEKPDDVWREKLRQDAIRTRDYEVVRLIWTELRGDREVVRKKVQAALDLAAARAA